MTSGKPRLTVEELKDRVGAVPDFPQPGIIFRDITTLMADGEAFPATIDHLVDVLAETPGGLDSIDGFAGVESRGFVFAAALGYVLGKPVIVIRKPGKLPRPVISIDYDLEYGSDRLELQPDDIPDGAKVVVVDDLIATGGSAVAATRLLRQAGAVVDRALFAIALPELPGLETLAAEDVHITHLLDFDGH